MTDQIKVNNLVHELNRRAARAVVGQLGFRSSAASNYLRNEFEKLPGEKGSFMADIVFESTFGWHESNEQMGDLKDSIFSEKLLTALSNPPTKPEDLRDHEFPLSRHPYTHQLEAWKLLLAAEKKSVLVTSGTGSGKTECFLVPIIQDLSSEIEETGNSLTGVRALFLYPLNALINSQRERLKAWTNHYNGKMRFCLYNGETPNRRTQSSVMKESPEEVRDRIILRESPPPILVTNSTMLEYMLVRNDDIPIIKKSQGSLRWIVLDEAHTYIGSQAAELALLLRRVLVAFGVKAEDVRFVATSATIGSGDKSTEELRKFLADIAGVKESQIHVVKGQRDVPGIITAKPDISSKFEDVLRNFINKSKKEQFEFLCNYPPALKIRKMLAQAPCKSSELIEGVKTFWQDVTKPKLWQLMDLMAGANDGISSFLPIRVHIFQKTLDGIYACTDPKCEVAPDELIGNNWAFGKIYLSDREHCDCGGPVQPIVSCTNCGQEYLKAAISHNQSIDKYELLQPNKLDEEDEYLWDREDERDENDEEQEKVHDDGDLVFLSSKENGSSVHIRLRKGSRELLEKGENEDILIYAQSTSYNGVLTCHACSKKETASKRIFMQKRLGAPFFLGDSLPTLLEYSPKHGEGPFNSRRLLTFTDSRQGTARMAARLQQDVDVNKVRSVLYHAVHVQSRPTDPKVISDIRRQIKSLEEVVKTTPSLRDLLNEKKEELADKEKISPRIISWKEAEEILMNDINIKSFMFDTFNEIAIGNIEQVNFGRFNLCREFMRRPLRAFQLETLGMVEIFYPPIEEIKTVPECWGQLYQVNDNEKLKALEDWKDWLTIIIDVFIRGNSAVDFPENWRKLMGAKVTRKYLLAPGDDRKDYSIQWPSIYRSKNSKLVTLLLRGFALDDSDSEVMDHIEDILQESWIALKNRVLSIQDEKRYLLDLRNNSAFRKINNAWKCPYTHRVVSRLFRGQSPNTSRFVEKAFKCDPIKLPDLPFPHEIDNLGRDKLVNWLDQDPLLKIARDLSVWPNRADRIATGEPWFRIAEHSAQIDSQQLKKYEKLFKSGKLNVLSCSTTMEMGVDIGGMSVVSMNNVPPHPANYLQRAGRAGRRNESISISYTLCKSNSHSMQVFHNPKWPFEPGALAAPRVSLESSSIVQRHVNALLLAYWLRRFGDDKLKLQSGWLFEKKEEESAKADEFINWCNSLKYEPDYKTLSENIKAVVQRTCNEAEEPYELAYRTASKISSVYKDWWRQYSILLEQQHRLKTIDKYSDREPAVIAVEITMTRMRKEYLLRDLATFGFLPGYGFPTNVVSLNDVTKRELNIKQKRGREDNFGKMRGGPSRDLAVALREFAPGAEIVMKGVVYRSAGITLNWHLPSELDAYPEIQNIEQFWECKSCGQFGFCKSKIMECESCKSSQINFAEVLKPAGFAVDLFEDPHTNVNQPTYIPFEEALVSASGDWSNLSNNLLGQFRYSENGLVTHISKGMHGHGYTLCLCCGRAEPQESSQVRAEKLRNEHKKLRGGKGSDGSPYCDGSSNDYAIKKDLFFTSKVETSVFELQLRHSTDDYKAVRDLEIAWTIGFTLRNALTKYLGIDQREVNVAVRDIKFEDGTTGFSLSLYDTASQGAGYVKRLEEKLIPLMKIVRKNLECPVSCDSACQHCLIDSSSQYKEKYLNRFIAMDWLNGWLEKCKIPVERCYFGENTSQEITSIQYQLQYVLHDQHVDIVQFFIELSDDEPEDFSNDTIVKTTKRLISNGRKVEWILTGVSLDEWKNRCGTSLLELLKRYPDNLLISHMSAQNKIGQAGKFIMAVVKGDKGYYWAGENAYLNLSDRWGISDGPLIKSKPINKLKLPLDALSIEDFEVIDNNLSASIKIQSDYDGDLAEFGNKFILSIVDNFLILAEKFKDNIKLEKLSYSDRYLCSPLYFILLQKILSSILEKYGDITTLVEVTTAEINSDPRNPYRLFHNFYDTEQRDKVLRGVLSNLSNNFKTISTDRSNLISHARTLTLVFQDNSVFEIDFDQGMGAWKILGDNSWNGYDSEENQVKSILSTRGRVSLKGPWPTIINFRIEN